MVLVRDRSVLSGEVHQEFPVPLGPQRSGRGGARPTVQPPSSKRRLRFPMTSWWSEGSRTTPPLPTWPLPTSNWGLIRAIIKAFLRRCSETGGTTSFREMNETSITAPWICSFKSEGFEVTDVCFFQHQDAGILAKSPVELTVSHVHRDHLFGPPLEQTVGEPPCRCPHVHEDLSRYIHRKGIEGRLQLQSTTAHIGGIGLFERDGRRGGYLGGPVCPT